jgi:hypothetical protein
MMMRAYPHWHTLPVMVTTGLAEAMSVRKAAKLGVRHYLGQAVWGGPGAARRSGTARSPAALVGRATAGSPAVGDPPQVPALQSPRELHSG